VSEAVELLAIDLGDKRTGLARANLAAKIPEPLQGLTLQGGDLVGEILAVAKRQGSGLILVGLPISLSSSADSAQTAKSRVFATELAKYTNLPIKLVDEALSTAGADKWRVRYPKAGADSLAACVILERYMEETVQK